MQKLFKNAKKRLENYNNHHQHQIPNLPKKLPNLQ